MRKLAIISGIIASLNLGVNAQDMFKARQLTFESAQEGFSSWSPDGKKIVYQYTDMRDTTGTNGLWIMAPDGSGKQQIFSGVAEHAKWSPDGRYIVFDADTGQSIKMIKSEGGDPIIFLPDSVKIDRGGLPCWSPDASKIAYKDSDNWLCVYDMGTRQVERIYLKEGLVLLPACWTPDGKYIIVALMNMETRKSGIWKISSDGNKIIEVKGHDENFYRHIALSPDGTMLVYALVIDERYLGLYIMPADGRVSLPLTITPGGHNEGPSWSPDGKTLTFTSTRANSFDIWAMYLDIEIIKKKFQTEEKK